MFSLSNRQKNRIFEWEFRFSIAVGLILMAAVVVLGWRIYTKPPSEHVDVGVMFATGALALFI